MCGPCHKVSVLSCVYVHVGVVKNCPPLTNPVRGQVLYTGTSPGSTAQYVCFDGYELIGDANRECKSDGTWTGSEPICQGELAMAVRTGI